MLSLGSGLVVHTMNATTDQFLSVVIVIRVKTPLVCIQGRGQKVGSWAMATVKEVQAKLNTHEAVCAERWKETIERIKRLELVMITSAGAVIILMAGMLWKI